ncbi:hypothetical protein IP81_05120 [Novosphingobium sp. AAP83]|uniref:hypothetical protein n=1 Tax=Novosphingobium sp. AAP83 TaxID=1523425 RepID=UPI0006CDFDA8|nr:hypothetical protein [Novosphingobium sp. AAP83]KPF92792.1 hypothetical protein IP81_05120 [Novosphingobium sp. AAP83]
MKINCASAITKAFSCAACLLVAACSAPPVAPPPPPPPVPRPAAPLAPPPPSPSPPPAAFKEWRDAPQTPGDWRYAQREQGSVAQFGTVFMLACNRASGTVSLIRSGASAVSLPMSIVTSSQIRALSAEPAPQEQPQLIATVRTTDSLLDAIAFSRGRFAVEVNGLSTLYLPAWAEIGRVIEDCRSR